MDFLQHKKTVKEIFSIIDNLLMEQYETPAEQESAIIGLQTDVQLLRNRMVRHSKSFPYKRVEITFRGKYEIKIRALSEEFNRTLVGDMYFKAVGGNQNSKFMDIRTRSFPEDLVLRLHYQNLDIGTEQRGKGELIYDRRGKFGAGDSRVRKSNEIDITFAIRKLK